MADMDEENMRTIVDMSQKFGLPRRRTLYRVPAHLRENMKHIYEPVVVSLGPYYHRRDRHLDLAEPLKSEILDILCSGANDKGFLLSKISERLVEIKNFYYGEVWSSYDDKKLAEMMLRDVCFVLYYMEQHEHSPLIWRHLGMSGAMVMRGDVYMMENQIPLWLINLLIPLVYQGEQAQSFLLKYLSYSTSGYNRGEMMTKLPWGEEEEEPLHLLEAIHRFFICHVETNFLQMVDDSYIRNQNSTLLEVFNSPFRSVTDLKAKGIHVGS